MADSSSGNTDISTTLGPDAVFKGELSFEKGLRIQGRLEGKVTSGGKLHIAKEAKLQADVEAGAIVVEGDVHGNLVANDRIELKQSARYEGDLRANKLVVDEGAVFSGHVSVGPESVKGRPSGSGPQRGIGAGANMPSNQPGQQQGQPQGAKA